MHDRTPGNTKETEKQNASRRGYPSVGKYYTQRCDEKRRKIGSITAEAKNQPSVMAAGTGALLC